MVPAGKSRLKKLLLKGLTGWEVGVLFYQEGLIIEDRGSAWLTEVDRANLRNNLTTKEDVEGYNDFRETVLFVDRYIYTACAGGMAILNRLLKAKLFLKDCLWHWRTREARHWGPVIVTQKQYENIKAEHRKTCFNENYPIDQVLAWRTMAIAPDDIKKKLNYPADLEEQSPDLYGKLFEKAKRQIKELIRAGTIKITHYEGDFSKEERRKIRGLEKRVKVETLNNEEWEVLLDKAYISGEQLYNSGLPEWPGWIEGEEDFLDKDDYYQVAIIQKPAFFQVDKKGYYKDPEEEFHEDPWFFNDVNKRLIKRGTSYTKIVQGLIARAKVDLAGFLAYRTAIEDFYRVTVGAKYYGVSRRNLEACYLDIGSEIESLNKEIKDLQDICNMCNKSGKHSLPVIDALSLELIDITKVKPDAGLSKEVRKWITQAGAGENWWKKGKATSPEDGEEEKEADAEEG
jgi:hypothetical protein